MIARRDVIRLVTATAAARHLPFALSPAEASAKLDEPVPFDAGIAAPTLDYTGYPMPSPTAFAEDLRQVMDLDSFGWFADGAPGNAPPIARPCRPSPTWRQVSCRCMASA